VLTLALGLAACVGIFSVVHAVLLRQLAYQNAERLVTLTRLEPRRDLETTSLSQPDVRDLAGASALERLVGYQSTSFVLGGGERPEVVAGAAVGDGLLGVFGLAPQHGRDLRAEEALPDGPKVVVLSHAFWLERFGADGAVLGRNLTLDGTPFEVVGVAPPGFDFPGGTQLWMPTDVDEEGCGRGCNLLKTVGRLEPGADLARAQSELDTIAAHLREEYPEESFDRYFRVEGLRDQMVGSVRRGLWVLLGAVGCVLLIAIANVANLVLAYGTDRRDELALRSALGAGRGRLLWLLALENGLVVAAAGVIGTAAAWFGVRALVALAPPSIPRLDGVRLDGPVLAFALALVASTTLLFGLVPAWRLVRRARTLTLRSRGAEGARARGREVLLAAEVALSLVLLLAAGLLLRSFQRLLEVELGFRPERVTTFFLVMPESRYDAPEKVATFFEQLEPRLAALPGVEAAGAILGAPLDRNNVTTSLGLLDRPEPPPGQEESAAMRAATPGYFAAAGVPLLEGRLFQESDRHGAPAVAVVNRTLAERYYPNETALGKQIALGVDFGWVEQSWTIVGVVGDVRSAGLTEEPPPEVYLPQSQIVAPWLTYLVRAKGDTDVLRAIESEVGELDPDLPLRRPETMEVWVDRARGPALFFLTLVGVFAALALALAAVGLYGVVAYVVSRRTREIAIRMAVGADRGRILGLVLRQGGLPVLAGLGLGLGASLLGGSALRSLLFEVGPHDAATVVTVTLVLLAVSLLAMLVPARRASRIAPARALGTE
jgi:predicted permease